MTNFLKLMTLTTFVAFSSTAIAQDAEAPETVPADTATTEAATTENAPADEAAAEGEAAAGETPEALNMGEEVVAENAPGTTYVREKFEAWELRCVRVEEGQKEPCQLFQLMRDKDGNAISEINLVVLKDGGKAVAGATIIVPLETLLPKQITLAVDGGNTKRYPFRFCGAAGCYAQVGFASGDVSAFKKGAAAALSIVPAFAPDKTITAKLSLSGFTKAYDMLQTLSK